MATALKVQSPPEPAACGHVAFNAWQTLGGYPDDMTLERGKCAGCQAWLEITTWISTGYSEERALDAGEIRELMRSELF